MSGRTWFVHLSGETFGPLTDEVLLLMLQQNRLQFSDFVWTEGFNQWHRISEIEQFSELLPSYPEAPIPAAQEAVVEEAAPEPEPEPEPEPPPVQKPAPRAQPKPAAARPAAPKAAPAKPAPIAKPVEAEPAKPPVRRHTRVALDGTVAIEGVGEFSALDISESGVLIQADIDLAEGESVKLKISSAKFPKPLDMNALVVRQEVQDGQRIYGIEFIKVNPAHKRAIAAYVKSYSGDE